MFFGNEKRFEVDEPNHLGPGIYYDKSLDNKRLWKTNTRKTTKRREPMSLSQATAQAQKMVSSETIQLNKALEAKGIILPSSDYKHQEVPGPCSYDLPLNSMYRKNKKSSGNKNNKMSPNKDGEQYFTRFPLTGVIRTCKGKDMYYEDCSLIDSRAKSPGPGYYDPNDNFDQSHNIRSIANSNSRPSSPNYRSGEFKRMMDDRLDEKLSIQSSSSGVSMSAEEQLALVIS